MDSKPRVGSSHPDKGAAAAAAEEMSVLEKLSKPLLPGESMNRRR